MNIEYRIDKNKLIDKFNTFIDKSSSPSDTYNSKGKEVQYRNDYTILDKIKEVYKFVVDNIKMDLRREFIHDDKKFYEIFNLLNDRINNKVRARTDGSLYVMVGLDKPIKFTGDDDQYKEYVYLNKSKQQQLIRKIVEELNSVLEKNENEEEDRAIINDNDLPDPPKVLTSEDIADHILSNIPSDYIIEIHKGNFENFDKSFSIFISESTIDHKMGEKLLDTLHTIYKYNKVYWDTIEEADKDKKVKSDVDKRIQQSRETLTKRGLEPAGGVWQDDEGVGKAKIDDQGNIENISQDEQKDDSASVSNLVGQFQKQKQQPTQPQPDADEEKPEEEPEEEIGIDDTDLEKIRLTFDDENTNGETEDE